MYNDLFHIGRFTVHGYGLMIGLGIVASLMLSWRRAKPRGIPEDAVSALTILAVVIGFVGAKIFFILTHWSMFAADPLGTLGSEGFVVYGGILFGFLAALIYCRRRRESFFLWADILLPGVAAAQALGRVGCFLAGCCYGKPTASRFGVVFPQGSFAPAGIPLWPTQLFSAAGDLLLCLFLLYIDRRPHREGHLAVWYLLLYGVGRFAVEFLRNDVRGSVGALSASQFLSLFSAAGALLLSALLRRRRKNEV